MGFSGLERTKEGIFKRLGSLFSAGLGESFYEGLEEALILADAGADTAGEIVDKLRERIKKERISDEHSARAALIQLLSSQLKAASDGPEYEYPLLIMMVGVNGAGKTTAIGKMADMFANGGRRVMLAAADTFRAAAADQLELWAIRTNAQIVRQQQQGGDPGAVVFDAIAAAKARSCDVILCDTAGRLQNKKNLMDELAKIRRVIGREFTGCVKTILVLDATTGRNGLEQARVFKDAAEVDGIMLTKLDGTAKGGIVLAVAKEYGLPVWYCGVGEGPGDMEKFDAEGFARALFE